ncbi:MAG: PQQ-dependent sugar dehydrogenase [Sphingomonas sp.]
MGLIKWSIVPGVAMMLASCSGGEPGAVVTPTPTPSPSSSPPTFTSSGSITVPETATGVIYTATATDPDSTTLTFSIRSGGDGALFFMNPDGKLSFGNPPNFDAPTDANHDNIYEVPLQVSDGINSVNATVLITVSMVPDRYQVRKIGELYDKPVYVAPASIGLFVVEKGGMIKIAYGGLTNGVQRDPFLDIRDEVSTDGERGLLGMAPAPDFSTSFISYVSLTNLDGDIEIRRYKGRIFAQESSMEILITIPHRDFADHNGGWIGFGPDGYLYVAVGDGGGSGDPANNAQNTNVLLGKVLRLDVSRDDYPADPTRNYAIPADNPFVSGGGAPEVWAYGLRHPYRMSFDGPNLLIGDIGENGVEEIDLLRPSDAGANLGWPILEGTHPFKGSPVPGLTMPVAEYLHGSSTTQGSSIVGGYVYRGRLSQFRGLYIFADFASDNIWSIPVDRLIPGETRTAADFTLRNTDFAPITGVPFSGITSFAVNSAQDLYYTTIGGSMYRIEPPPP